MKNQTIHRFATVLIALATFTIPLASHAELHSKSKEIVVLLPKDLPEQAQLGGESLLLHSDSAGSTYLYLEQQEGARLTVLNVTDPARIKPVSSIPLKTEGAFDFMQPLNNRAELVRFRRSGCVAVLDLSKAKRPALRTVASLDDLGTAEPLGLTGFIVADGTYKYVSPVPRDFRVVDVSRPFDPALLTTIKQVKDRVVNDETGTTFLLGGEGLSVIRQPAVEEAYRDNEIQMDHN
jgi:hypothetical protein